MNQPILNINEGALVVVPSIFLSRLKAIDKGLDCKYSQTTDKFVILHNNHIVYTVGNRYPDDREISIIAEADLRRKGHIQRRREAEEYARNYREKKAKEAQDNLHDMTMDSKIQLKNAYAKCDVGGKCNSTFRRIERKPKGKIF